MRRKVMIGTHKLLEDALGPGEVLLYGLCSAIILAVVVWFALVELGGPSPEKSAYLEVSPATRST